jgi:hypothetical protein
MRAPSDRQTLAEAPVVTMMGVQDIVSLAGNDPNNLATNSARISDFRNQFSEIAEPGTAPILVVCGAFAFLFRLARVRSRPRTP